jgi:NTE family protein
MPAIGLVLGAGGAVGHAFHSGVLGAIADETGFDARDAEIIVGTSAGSIIGAYLRAGFSPADIVARATDQPLSPEGAERARPAEDAHRGLPAVPNKRPAGSTRAMSAPRTFARALLPPWGVRPGAAIAAALPAGTVPTELITAGLRPLLPTWPEAALWINAVSLATGRRVTFGRDLRISTDVATAVSASCAIPTFFEPVTIDGVRYIDGATHSPTNADLLAGLDLDLVVIVSPMSMASSTLRFTPDQPARRISRLALAREATRVRNSGTPVLTFQPTIDDLAVMGLNAMEGSKRVDVARQAALSTRARLQRWDAADRVAILAKADRPPR